MNHRMLKIVVNICRMVVALTFIFSGFVKAIDPLGTQYKIQDYLAALELETLLPGWASLAISVGLSALEFCLGIFLLFAINRRRVTRTIVVFMVLMTLVSLWLWIANPVSDCGCFGDAVKLTNGQTFLKNIVLLVCAIVTARHPLEMMRFISRKNQWIVMNYSAAFIILCSVWCLYDLPIFDFRPYHVGADIRKGMEIPEGAEQPQFETTFIMEKNGLQKEFTLDNYPDSTWTFVDSKTVQTSEGYIPPIHDLSMVAIDPWDVAKSGDDIAEAVVGDAGYVFLLISPHLENANDGSFGEIDHIHQYAEAHGYPFYCLTASNAEGIRHWQEITGAEYEFCQTDEITLKTIVRSNPGLLLMKDGVVYGKWSHNRLPSISEEQMSQPLEKLTIGQMAKRSVGKRMLIILLCFVFPLLLLTVIDRFRNIRKSFSYRKRMNNKH